MKTGIHITACNTGSAEKHNRRDKDYLEKLDASGKKTYDIYRDETHLNSSWVNPRYQGRTLTEILEDSRQEVKAGSSTRQSSSLSEKLMRKQTLSLAGSSFLHRTPVCI